MEYTPYFSRNFKDSISGKYSGVKRFIESKLKIIIKKPFSGEPLRHDLDGLRSTKVKSNFLIIYVICKECRLKGNDEKFNCSICANSSDNSIIFIYFGPHDDAYKIAKKMVIKGDIYN